jgi:hypothetical protein
MSTKKRPPDAMTITAIIRKESSKTELIEDLRSQLANIDHYVVTINDAIQRIEANVIVLRAIAEVLSSKDKEPS